MARTDAMVCPGLNLLTRFTARINAGIGKFCLISAPRNRLGCATTPWLTKFRLKTKNMHTRPLKQHPPDGSARTARGLGGYTRGCARAHPPTQQKDLPR